MGFMRAAVALGLAALFLVPAGGPLSPAGLSLARVVSSFSNGSESGLLELRPPDENRELSISIPEHCYVVDASLSISTALSDGGWFPEAPVLDLEGDGKPEWAFCATGAGTFGLQTVTATGERTVELRFPSAGSQSFSLLLPKGALVTGASLNVSGRLDGIQFTNASIYGHGSYDMLGLSVAGGVDINRDGVDDVVIGAPGADTRGMTDNGAVAVLYGPLDGPLPAPDSVEGTESGELLGFSVAAVRDFDGDGFGEVLAGAPNATPRGAGTPTPNAGIALLLPYDTSAGRLRSVPARTIPGLTVNGQMGFSVAEIPDFNGDGRRDIAAGEILANRTVLQPYIGRVAALCSGELAPAPVNFWGESPYSLFGFCILRGPDSDLNRDGKPDLAIGSPLASPGGKGMVGAVYIFTGPEGGPWLVIQGDQPSGNFSASLAAGDFNGDGVADLAVGAPAMKNEGTETGAVVVYFGGKRGIDSSVSPVVLWGPLERARYGASLACPGDLDLDGCDELLVGAPGAARPAAAQRTGAVEVLFLGRNESVWIWGERPNENFGFSLSAAGDVNGDGLRDFIVGAPTSTGGSLEACGRAVVFTTHLLAPLNPSVCVGGLGADDWSFRGYYTRDLRIPDFSSKLNGLLQNPLREVEDEFGNVLVEIPVVVRSESAGTLIVHDISIAYKWTALVDRNPSAGNLTNSLNALLSHSASGNATRTIPLVLTSATPGSVWVHSPRIVIDEPPSCREDVAVELPEDTRDEHLLDLRSVFSDDFDTEELVFSLEGWTNASIVSLGISGGRWLSADALTGEANDNWTGEVEAAVSARDSRNLSRTARVLVSVVPVNDPPVFTGEEPPHEATVGLPYVYNPAVVDSDGPSLSFWLEGAPEGMSVSEATGELRWTPGLAQLNRSYTVTLWVSDGELENSRSWTLRVTGRLMGVRFNSTPPRTVYDGETYFYRPSVYTDVPGASISLALSRSPEGMRLENGTVIWNPPHMSGMIFEAALNASDGFFTAEQSWRVIVLSRGWPNSSFGCIFHFPDNGSRVSGMVRVGGSSWALDEVIESVELSVDGGRWRRARGVQDWEYWLDTSELPNGPHTISARACAGPNYSPPVSITVIVDNPPETLVERVGDIGLIIIGLLILLAVAGASAGLYMKRKRAAGAAPPSPAPPAPPVPPAPGPHTGAAPAAGAAAAAPGPPAAPAPPLLPGEEEEFAVEDVFLVYIDGRLIHHSTRRLATGVDTEILSSMLTALTSFVRDALSKTGEATVGSLEYGGNKIIFEMGRWVYLAVVITTRQEPLGLREEMRQAVRNVESEFGAVLPDWDGNVATLAGAKRLLAPLTSFTVARPTARAPPPEVEVSVLGELEFYQGYVRLKVAVKNSSPAFIMDAALKVMYNESAFRLERIEPEYPLSGREILLGNIGIKEKKTVALYLDPQICTESYIDATLTFRDAQGNLHHADMRRKLASVVCPIMHTDENINVAMLRRMLEAELDQKDSKVFSLPQGLSPEKAFELCKRAVQSHDIRLVREFEERSPSYVGEAWYFGRVKGRPERLVVRASVREDTSSAEFYVASDSKLVLTGLLAELKNDLNREYRKEMASERQMEPVLDPARRERVRRERTLLDRHAEAEASGTNGRGPSAGG